MDLASSVTRGETPSSLADSGRRTQSLEIIQHEEEELELDKLRIGEGRRGSSEEEEGEKKENGKVII